MKYLKLILLLILALKMNLGKSQDTICVELNDYREILKLANTGYLCDSLITTYDSTIITLEKIIIEKNDQIQLSGGVINGLANEVKRLKTINILLGISTGALIIGLLAVLL